MWTRFKRPLVAAAALLAVAVPVAVGLFLILSSSATMPDPRTPAVEAPTESAPPAQDAAFSQSDLIGIWLDETQGFALMRFSEDGTQSAARGSGGRLSPEVTSTSSGGMYELDGQTLTVDNAPVSSIRWAATDTSSSDSELFTEACRGLFTVSELELLAPGRLNEVVVSDECAGDAGVERQWVKISSPTPTASERTAPSEPDLTLFWYRVGTDGELLRMYRGDVPDDNQGTFAIA